LPFVLNGSEIQSSLRVGDELQLTGNKVIWKILGPMNAEVSGQFRIPHKKEHHDNISHLLLNQGGQNRPGMQLRHGRQ
jgi:hypothetical protein